MWKNFYDKAVQKNEENEFEEANEVLNTYRPKEIGKLLIPCYIRQFLVYRAEVIRENDKGIVDAGACPCAFWLYN